MFVAAYRSGTHHTCSRFGDHGRRKNRLLNMRELMSVIQSKTSGLELVLTWTFHHIHRADLTDQAAACVAVGFMVYDFRGRRLFVRSRSWRWTGRVARMWSGLVRRPLRGFGRVKFICKPWIKALMGHKTNSAFEIGMVCIATSHAAITSIVVASSDIELRITSPVAYSEFVIDVAQNVIDSVVALRGVDAVEAERTKASQVISLFEIAAECGIFITSFLATGEGRMLACASHDSRQSQTLHVPIPTIIATGSRIVRGRRIACAIPKEVWIRHATSLVLVPGHESIGA